MKRISRRTVLRAAPLLSAAALFGRQPTDAQATGVPLRSPAETRQRALDAGNLTVALVPNDWANYAGVIKAFTQKFGLPVQTIDVKGNANAALDALRKSGKTETHPLDVVDLPLAAGVQAKIEGLLTPYFPASWARIPAFLKDRQGFWAGSHFGVLTFEVNSEVIPTPPQDWADLLKPEFKDTFALAGDPRKLPLATNSVFSAALAASGPRANGRSGLDFFRQLKKAGTLLPTVATPETLNNGKTPITFIWDYQALQARDQSPNKIKVVVPKHGVLAKVMVQGVNARAANPYGARLWLDFLHSDEGQLLLLKGYARSTWFGNLTRRGVIPAEQLEKLPAAADYTQTIFPSVKQAAAALKTIVDGWDSVLEG